MYLLFFPAYGKSSPVSYAFKRWRLYPTIGLYYIVTEVSLPLVFSLSGKVKYLRKTKAETWKGYLEVVGRSLDFHRPVEIELPSVSAG